MSQAAAWAIGSGAGGGGSARLHRDGRLLEAALDHVAKVELRVVARGPDAVAVAVKVEGRAAHV